MLPSKRRGHSPDPSTRPTATRRPEYRRFLQRLRNARLGAGLTQVDAARRLRRPQSFVSKCESGERRVDVVELAQFARLYRKDVRFFLS